MKTYVSKIVQVDENKVYTVIVAVDQSAISQAEKHDLEGALDKLIEELRFEVEADDLRWLLPRYKVRRKHKDDNWFMVNVKGYKLEDERLFVIEVDYE